MHKDIYASGFLYNVPTQQILLQQLLIDSASETPWSFFSGKARKNEAVEKAFQRIVDKQLGIKLANKHIHLVYDYEDEEGDAEITRYIVYGEVKTMKKRFSGTCDWFTFKQLNKLPLLAQTKQDLIVAERVVKLVERNLLPPAAATK